MRLWISLFFVLTILLATTLVATAETGYITDQVVLTLRSGPGNQYETLDHLRTDTRVEILSEDDKYARVRTDDGKEGFVLKQYLTSKTPKLQVINRQAKEIEELRSKIKASTSSGTEIQQQFAELKEANSLQEKNLQEAQDNFEKLSNDYQQLLEASGNLMQTTQERDQLREENIALAAEAGELREENIDLLTTGSIKWFLAGAGVLFFGWFMGKISRKKHRPF